MRAYFKPRKAHPICLYLTADEAARLLESLDSIGVDQDAHPELSKAQRMLNRAFDELEDTL
ncbi:hypothetical protein [Streptomyces sp. NPDC006638]|uniref:hypothetical protein n=1 Tax=Streptomyces sp. NPDC006638 TaxID=3157183 RepID=UPI0033A88914